MSDEQNQRPQQSDFFTDLMFGRPPAPESREQEKDSEQQQPVQKNQSSPEANNQHSNEQGDQLANIIALVQSLSPYLVKLAPLASKVASMFNQDDEKDTSSKKKNAND
ncbi:hypothetical protein [Halalkalibacter alkaliphilus]|uniref:YqfQ-like protein n=1 Tax=Halalkalibacter alkaliphilus TaxID=2917993 RepID=A0A9X2CU09_9BACI|nr:hypothetical protein [Halalkalibacter alkaliphilus]MCL7748201.1 hypothetical protein [Halalkalibacter alkaliphilus]